MSLHILLVLIQYYHTHIHKELLAIFLNDIDYILICMQNLRIHLNLLLYYYQYNNAFLFLAYINIGDNFACAIRSCMLLLHITETNVNQQQPIRDVVTCSSDDLIEMVSEANAISEQLCKECKFELALCAPHVRGMKERTNEASVY